MPKRRDPTVALFALTSSLAVGVAAGACMMPDATLAAYEFLSGRPDQVVVQFHSMRDRLLAMRSHVRSAPAPAPRRAPEWLERAVCERADDDACEKLALAIDDEASAAQLDPVLVLAVIQVESSWDPDAVSSKDARGLMQLREGTFKSAARHGRVESDDPHHPVANVRAGIRYLARLHRIFGDRDLALVAYNAGPNRLRAYLREQGGVPERFLVYPERVRRAERKLRGTLNAPAQHLVARAGGAFTAVAGGRLQ